MADLLVLLLELLTVKGGTVRKEEGREATLLTQGYKVGAVPSL